MVLKLWEVNCLFTLGLLAAFVSGLLALLLPYWVSAKFEAVRTVTVVKEIDSGLFKDQSIYYMKYNNPPDESDNPFIDISGTHVYPAVVTEVKVFMIVGLSCLSIHLMYSIARCFYRNHRCYGDKTNAIISVPMSIMTIISGGFILSCPFLYKVHAIADVEPEKISLGASWWLALISAALAIFVGLGAVIHFCCVLYFKPTCCLLFSKPTESHGEDNEEKEVFNLN